MEEGDGTDEGDLRDAAGSGVFAGNSVAGLLGGSRVCYRVSPSSLCYQKD